jgi:pilus assembly protein CpaE
MPGKSITVKLNIKDHTTVLGIEEAVSTVPGCSISSNGASCDVLFMEIGSDLGEEFKFLEHVMAKSLAREVFLTSSQKDPDVLLKALKMGVKEFFVQPLNKEEVIASLTKLITSTEARGPEKVKEKKGALVSIIGSKGGVGATTAAVNLAVSLKQMAEDKSVALMDMNPLLGGVHLFLDIKNTFSWADGARDISRMDSTYLLNTLYKHPTGIHVLPAPSKPSGLEAATPEVMEQLVGFMRSAFDIIVIDGCKSFDDLSLRMLALSDTILVIAELNILSIVNAKRLIETFDGLGLTYRKDIKIVINRYQKKNMISPDEAEKILGRKIVTMIQNDYEMTMSAINTGKTLSDVAWKSVVMENFRELAASVLHKEAPRKGNPLFNLNPLNFLGKK